MVGFNRSQAKYKVMMNTNPNLKLAAEELSDYLTQTNTRIVTAESCTGGWLAQCLTAIAGSSAWFDRGFITYSNAAKTQMLQVKPETIEHFGAISAEVAKQMLHGALQNSLADHAIAITGIAGPTGGTVKKPVGTVYIAWQKRFQPEQVILEHFNGNRLEIRQQAVYKALRLMTISNYPLKP